MSYEVAKARKPHTIVEDLILPPATGLAETMLRSQKNFIDNAFIKKHSIMLHP